MTVQDVLSRLEGVKGSGGTWTALCPAHEDSTPSLSVSEGHKGVVLHCHAGCDFEDVTRALGMEPGDLFHETNGDGRPEIIATYDYVDEDGELLFQVVRRFPKSFRQRRPDGRGGWEWTTKGTRRVLYRLPEVVEAVALGKRVHVVEGERDVHAIEDAGGIATTNPGGAGKWRPEYSETLRGARVRIVADKDEAGREHAEEVAASLDGVAESVEVVEAREGKDPADHLAGGHGLDDFLPVQDQDRKLPAPMGVSELLILPEPEEDFQVEGLFPVGNVLIAGYPKTYKTMFLLLLAVCLAAGVAFLGFPVPKRRRVGLVLMEDQAHRVRYRLRRLCAGLGLELRDLDGWLHLWFRPPLRLNDATGVELGEYAAELGLDFLGVDSWAYVASGDSNSADDVTPQLQTFSSARVKQPGLTTGLVHHARKDWGKDAGGTRLTDEIRNSGAFGAWYDAGIVLSRKDETSPVKVRAELRDFPAPEGFAFTVEDEDPAGPHNGYRSGGWLRLQVSDYRPELLDRMAAAEKLIPAVRQYLQENPGSSKRGLREAVTGKARDVDAALEKLEGDGLARVEEPSGPGKSSHIYLVEAPE